MIFIKLFLCIFLFNFGSHGIEYLWLLDQKDNEEKDVRANVTP